MSNSNMASTVNNKRKTTSPPDGYVCKVCGIAGHWIQQCPDPAKNKRSRKNTNHIPVQGVDPSKEDIDNARQLQKIKPPNCFCGKPSRLKKVKRSNVREKSRAVGKYFFFCKLKKTEYPCRFARPVEDELQDKKERLCSFFVKNGSCKKGAKCKFSHELPDNLKCKIASKAQNRQQENRNNGEEKEKEEAKVSKENSSDNDSNSDDSDSDSSSDDNEEEAASQTKQKKNDSSSRSSGSSSSGDSDSSSSDSDTDDWIKSRVLYVGKPSLLNWKIIFWTTS